MQKNAFEPSAMPRTSDWERVCVCVCIIAWSKSWVQKRNNMSRFSYVSVLLELI